MPLKKFLKMLDDHRIGKPVRLLVSELKTGNKIFFENGYANRVCAHPDYLQFEKYFRVRIRDGFPERRKNDLIKRAGELGEQLSSKSIGLTLMKHPEDNEHVILCVGSASYEATKRIDAILTKWLEEY
ncbi:hypothetical protein HZC09_01205 [Candidatus Micrarchaeota archaeon]|nr:hypothetical protein [Candidatus Micrarchaeota archaeon]